MPSAAPAGTRPPPPRSQRLRGWFMRMGFRTKFLVVGVLLAGPLCALAGFAAAQFHAQVQQTEARAVALERAALARDLIETLALHRGLTASVLAGGEGLSSRLVAQQAVVQQRLAALLAVLPDDGSRPDLPPPGPLAAEVRALLALPDARDPSRNFERHNRVIDQLLVLMIRTGSRGATSNGPQLAGAYELAFVALPALVEALGRQRGWGSAVLQQEQYSEPEVARHLMLAGSVTQRLELLQADAHSMAELGRLLDPPAGSAVLARLREALDEAEVFSQRSIAKVFGRGGGPEASAQHFAEGTTAIERVLVPAREITATLQQRTRQQQQRAERWRAFSIAALVLVALGLAAVYREFSNTTVQRLKRLQKVSGRLAEGHFEDSITVEGSDEIAALADSLDAMRRRLRQAVDDSAVALAARQSERTRTEFLARWSHDLRTPLAAVLGFARLLGEHSEGALNAAQQADLQRIQTAAEHLLHLVDDVLAISTGELQEAGPRLQPLEAAALLRDATDLVQPEAERRGIRLHLELPAALPPVRADRTRLLQVLGNLLGNAIKFNHDRGWVAVRAAEHDGGLRIEVADGGPGIAPALLPRLFQPFERLDAVERGVPGSGLGLATARRLVDAMQGRIDVSSQPGAGTTFGLWLPLAGEAAAVVAVAPLPAGRLAYVEDNETNVELLRAMLAARTPLQLTAFADGASALASDERFDLWVLDHELPDTDGITLLQHLRQRHGPAIVAVLFTADVQPERRAAALAAGFADCWTKPLSVDALEASLRQLLPR